MAEVHKKLYESPDLAGIDFLNYLGYLLRTFGAMHREVSAQVQLTGDAINVGIEQAVPLGLIANELLSNVYKHAFPAGQVSAPHSSRYVCSSSHPRYDVLTSIFRLMGNISPSASLTTVSVRPQTYTPTVTVWA